MIATLFEDEELLVLAKPAGMHSVQLESSTAPSVAQWLLERHPAQALVASRAGDAGLIQRLDFETSGVLIAAKSPRVWELLRRMLQGGEVAKQYLALLDGELNEAAQVDNFIGSPNRGAAKMRVYEKKPVKSQRALAAQTGFTPVSVIAHGAATLVRAEAPTARRHQIRAHAAYLGFPLLGDGRYGSTRRLRQILQSDEVPQFFLHALSIGLRHPLSGGLIEICAPLPSYASGLGFGK